jgi:hypothetical protein
VYTSEDKAAPAKKVLSILQKMGFASVKNEPLTEDCGSMTLKRAGNTLTLTWLGRIGSDERDAPQVKVKN